MDHKLAHNEKATDYDAMGLSKRAQETLRIEPELEEHFQQCAMNEYDVEKNPQGIVSFGRAENNMAVELLRSKMETIAKIREEQWTYLYSPYGHINLKFALKKFIEHNFHPLREIDTDTLFVMNGATCAIEMFAFGLAMPGEYIMVPKPFYFNISYDLIAKARVNVLAVDQPDPSIIEKRYVLDVASMERAYIKAKEQGQIVCAIHITNPNNPTGDMYTRQELEKLLQFANRYKLHVIANELYSLTVFDQHNDFTSILSIPHPDPSRVHYIYGVGKDFGLSGYRIGVAMTRNLGVARYLKQVTIFAQTTGVSQSRLTTLLNDLDYFDNQFKPEMKRRLLARYQNVKELIEECGGRVHDSPCTIFRWLDLRAFLMRPDWEGEYQLFLKLKNEGVFLVAGKFFNHVTPGWFRMLAATEDHVHKIGMERLFGILMKIRAEKKQRV